MTLRYDRDLLEVLTDRFAASGHRLPELLRDIALGEAFTTVRPAGDMESTVAGLPAGATAQPTRGADPGQGVR